MTPETMQEALGHAVSDKRLEVLRLVAESGSISQAARDAGISYKAAWQAIDTLTSLSGAPLVERTVGGAGGGGARITPQGQDLLDLAQALAQARAAVLARFSAGAALAGGLGLRTSMRNQLACEVVRLMAPGAGESALGAVLRTPGGDELVASLTRESADLLGLAPGVPVWAMCKATAVTVGASLAAVPPVPGESCLLAGRVSRIAGGGGRDEVTLALEWGGSGSGLPRRGGRPRAVPQRSR
ncbi:MAG: LysR family transcriptional regulator [Burkholderiaceae bacterium]